MHVLPSVQDTSDTVILAVAQIQAMLWELTPYLPSQRHLSPFRLLSGPLGLCSFTYINICFTYQLTFFFFLVGKKTP
jgi:hypothetical protein